MMMDQIAALRLLKRLRLWSGFHGAGKQLLWDSGELPSRSFVIGFLQHLEAAFLNQSTSIEDVGNVARNIAYPYQSTDTGAGVFHPGFLNANGLDDVDEYGIVVGSDDTAETSTDYKLGTLITDGAGAGQLEYEHQHLQTTAVVGANVDFEWRRTFTNNSGASVDVKEIGVYVHTVKTESAYTTYYFCVAREVVATVTVNDGITLEVVLTLRTTV